MCVLETVGSLPSAKAFLNLTRKHTGWVLAGLPVLATSLGLRVIAGALSLGPHFETPIPHPHRNLNSDAAAAPATAVWRPSASGVPASAQLCEGRKPLFAGGPKTRPTPPAFLRGGLGLGGGGAETEEVTENVTWAGSFRRFTRREERSGEVVPRDWSPTCRTFKSGGSELGASFPSRNPTQFRQVI